MIEPVDLSAVRHIDVAVLDKADDLDIFDRCLLAEATAAAHVSYERRSPDEQGWLAAVRFSLGEDGVRELWADMPGLPGDLYVLTRRISTLRQVAQFVGRSEVPPRSLLAAASAAEAAIDRDGDLARAARCLMIAYEAAAESTWAFGQGRPHAAPIAAPISRECRRLGEQFRRMAGNLADGIR